MIFYCFFNPEQKRTGVSGPQLTVLERMVDEIIRLDPQPSTLPVHEADYIAVRLRLLKENI